jgi:hypothetical protein
MSTLKIAGLPIAKVSEAKPRVNMLVYGESGIGKGHPHGTAILTTVGWTKIENIVVGDAVIDMDGNPVPVVGVYPRGVLPTYDVIFNDGSQVSVDAEHLWVTRTNNQQHRQQPWAVLDTEYLRETLHRKWRIPMVEPIEFVSIPLDIHPYVMGVLLGDGSMSKPSGSVEVSTDIATMREVIPLLPESVEAKRSPGDMRSPKWGLYTQHATDNPVLQALGGYGLRGKRSFDKFIPQVYLFSSVENRVALLQGLMDTDGELTLREDAGSNVSYSTSSPQLAEDVTFLVQSLGGTVRRSVRDEPKYLYQGELKTGRPSYRLNFCLPVELVPFRSRKGYVPPTKYLPNRIIRDIVQAEDREVICLAVDSPSHTYVTEHCIVTHNTRLAGSSDAVPDMRRTLFVDVEGGTLTLRDLYPECETVRVRSWAEMQQVYEALFDGKHDYTTVVVDSLTEVQKMSMDAIMRKLIEEFEERSVDVPGLREWGINQEQTRKFVRAFRDLPMNTIFTALVKQDKNPRTGAMKRKPSLSGKLADEVSGFLDIVAYLYAKEIDGENKRILLCGQTEDTVAKDRSNKLPMTIEDPTMESIWQILNKEQDVAAQG